MEAERAGQEIARREYRRILIIKPSSLGDIVHGLPVLAALRAAHPDAHLAWLAGSAFAPLLEGHPLLNEVIAFDRRRFGRMLFSPRVTWEFLRFVGEVRRRGFDLVVDLQGLIRSGFLAFASGARARIGFADAREMAWVFYTRRAACAVSATHAVERNLELLRSIGITAGRPEFPLGVRPEELGAARARLREAAGREIGEYTAVLPGARWGSKQWPIERFAAVIDALHAASEATCVLLGAADERTAADRLRAATPAPFVDLVGRTSLRELVAMLALAGRVLCCDSGPMHIAAALNRPLLALFGPTSPARTGPYAPNASVYNLQLACSPCYERVCPLRHHHCMTGIQPEEVVARLRALPPG